MLSKIRFTCCLVAFVLALLTFVLVTVIGIGAAFGGIETVDILGAATIAAGGTAILGWSAWLAACSLDKMSGDPESMRVLAGRLADVTERVADRTRKAAASDQ